MKCSAGKFKKMILKGYWESLKKSDDVFCFRDFNYGLVFVDSFNSTK